MASILIVFAGVAGALASLVHGVFLGGSFIQMVLTYFGASGGLIGVAIVGAIFGQGNSQAERQDDQGAFEAWMAEEDEELRDAAWMEMMKAEHYEEQYEPIGRAVGSSRR